MPDPEDPRRHDGDGPPPAGGAPRPSQPDPSSSHEPAPDGPEATESADLDQPSAPVPSAHDRRAVEDDLEGFETARMRLLRRLRGVLALVVAVALLLPSGRWIIDELGFRTSRDDIAAALGEDAAIVDALWLVRATGCDGRVSSGSGFTLATRDGPVIVTNRHVVANAARVSVRPLAGGATRNVDAYRLATDADVAVLGVPEAEDGEVTLRTTLDASTGDVVRVVGFPSGRPTLSEGTVRSAGGGRLEVGAPTAPGASGSPVLDVDGSVVGQIFARTGDGAGLATSSSALDAAVRGAVPHETLEGPVCGAP
jgi:S1-C subfamily serine protease